MICIKPIHLKDANEFVRQYHRHNIPTVGGKFAPTADVVEVKHARYIADERCRACGTCGECGGDVTILNKYCPNCGAKMDGRKDDK